MNNKINRFSTNHGYWHTLFIQFLCSIRPLYIDRGRQNLSIYCIQIAVVIVGHKVFYRVFREKFLELAVELAGQGLVVRYYQSGFVQGGYDVGHGEGLAGTSDAQ